LRNIWQYAEEKRKIYCLEGTGVNKEHKLIKILGKYSSEDKEQASLSGLSTGKKNSAGKLRRLIILHAENVFLVGGMLVSELKKINTNEYHKEMNGVYPSWAMSSTIASDCYVDPKFQGASKALLNV
jgi:hypothetical protein